MLDNVATVRNISYIDEDMARNMTSGSLDQSFKIVKHAKTGWYLGLDLLLGRFHFNFASW